MSATMVRTTAVDSTPLASRNRLGKSATSEVAFLVALLLGWCLLYLVVLSGFQAGHTQSSLYDRLRSDLAAGLAPTGAPIAPGTPVALLDVPGVGLSHQVVVEGATPDLLRGGPGHVRGTVLPGQVGTSVVAGRSLTFGAPFDGIDRLAAGSLVVVRTQQGRFEFSVVGVRGAGDPIPAVAAGGSRLVLVTSTGASALSRSQTTYVDADLVGDPAPAGPRAEVSAADAPMSRDAGVTTWALLALSLQLLAIALGWFVWARARWSLIGAWTTGVPAILAAAWIATSVASRLLPNLV